MKNSLGLGHGQQKSLNLKKFATTPFFKFESLKTSLEALSQYILHTLKNTDVFQSQTWRTFEEIDSMQIGGQLVEFKTSSFPYQVVLKNKKVMVMWKWIVSSHLIPFLLEFPTATRT